MYIFGASGHAKVIIDILHRSGTPINGIFDDDKSKQELNTYQVSNTINVALRNEHFIIAIGDNRTRKKISKKLEEFTFGVAQHPDSTIADGTKLGSGSVIMANAVVNSSTIIGDHCIINTAAVVEHDCKLDNFIHISPNATVCGGVFIEEGALIGASSVILPGVKIGKWSRIGAGSVVVKEVESFSTVVGIPARVFGQ